MTSAQTRCIATSDRLLRLTGGFVMATVLGAATTAGGADLDAVARALAADRSDVTRQKAALSPAQQKVHSRLRDAMPPAPPARTVARQASWQRAGRARVIVTTSGTASAHVAALQAAGLEVEIVNDRFGLVQGWIADAAVATLAELDIVRSIAPAWPARHAAGSVVSEGDPASRAPLVRGLGYTGVGVDVGVISDGIDSVAASRASGDLAVVTVPPDARCRRGSGNEGTAMLEIVHDLAPGAELMFSGPETSAEMIDAIDCLTAAGADVIVDDLLFLGEPYFQDGPIALTAADAVVAGVSYHTAAGNYGNGRYLADDYRAGPEGLHDFDPGAGEDIVNRVVVPPGGEMLCVLQWADPFGASGNDYDLFLFELSTVTVVDASTTIQNGTQDPLEVVAIANPFSFALDIGIVIDRFAGAARPIKLLCPDTPMQYRSSEFGISGHASRPEVIAVAAIDARDPGLDDAEPFTSQGPAPIFFPTPLARLKPDLAAFDGVTTTVPGFAPFFGTSAAAPHSAAVAALLLSKAPTLSPAQVRAALTSTAVDIEAPGFDPVVGHGRIDALAAINAVGTTTTTTTVPPTTTPSTVPPTSTTSTVTSTTTTSTTLPACDPTDCDGDTCTVNDVCDGGTCRPGGRVTALRSSGLVRDAANTAAAACTGDRRKVVRKVVQPLGQATRLLAHAGTATGKKAARKLAQARRAAGRATRKLAAQRAQLSAGCAAALDAVVGGSDAWLACLP